MGDSWVSEPRKGKNSFLIGYPTAHTRPQFFERTFRAGLAFEQLISDSETRDKRRQSGHRENQVSNRRGLA